MSGDDRFGGNAVVATDAFSTLALDENHSSGRPLGSLLLSTEAGVSDAGERQLSGARRRRRTTPIGGCLTSRPAGLGLNSIPRTPQCLCPARMLDRRCWRNDSRPARDRRATSQAPFVFVWGGPLGGPL